MEDALIIGFDESEEDIAMLAVLRKKSNNSYKIINLIKGAEAIKLYSHLISKGDSE